MKKILLLVCAAALAVSASPASATERYGTRPPVTVSPDLSAPWVMQLGRKPGKIAAKRQVGYPLQKQKQPQQAQRQSLFGSQTQLASYRLPSGRVYKYKVDPRYLPQEVEYKTTEKPGTIVIDTTQNFLFLVVKDGKARRYGVGTGKPGFEWAGTHNITRKAVWPTWTPPAEMKVRERAKGRYIPDFMEGGPDNPMGARALYIGSTEYRIHGTNQPWTIGGAVSSGCIRMRNEDVVDLYERVKVGAKVTVI